MICNFFEIVFGIAFISLAGAYAASTNPKFKKLYSFRRMLFSYVIILTFITCVGYLSAITFVLSTNTVIFSYAITILINSFMIHTSQLIEHGNLIVEGNFNQRNIWTRNLKAKGVFNRIFLFLTHGDSREHVLHHTLVLVYSRPFPNRIPMPDKAVYISLKDLLKVFWMVDI